MKGFYLDIELRKKDWEKALIEAKNGLRDTMMAAAMHKSVITLAEDMIRSFPKDSVSVPEN